jgi:K+-transporting ATPase ATPase A chain
VSFVTSTNWQYHVPETTMSCLVQMTGLTLLNFLSAASQEVIKMFGTKRP